jgi:hypothetical protein
VLKPQIVKQGKAQNLSKPAIAQKPLSSILPGLDIGENT